MLLSVFTGPVRGLMFVARKIDDAVQQEFQAAREATMDALRKLHLRFEAGELDEADFERQEEALLNRLENLE